MKQGCKMLIGLGAALFASPSVRRAHADDAEALRFRSTGPLMLDAGLVANHPVALDTGLSMGVGAGASLGRTLVLGVRASWATATESSTAWLVTHDDLRLRLTGGVQRDVGRGRFALRLGVGPSLVHETRTRNQGARAGLSG